VGSGCICRPPRHQHFEVKTLDNYQDYRRMASEVADRGRYGDSMLMHVNPREVAALDQMAPGTITTNPDTGYPEAFLFGLSTAASLMILGAVGGGTAGGVTAKKRDVPVWQGVLGGAALGGMGGYGLGAGLGTVGIGTGTAAASTGIGAAGTAGTVGATGVPGLTMLGGSGAQSAALSSAAGLAPVAAGGLGSTEAMMALGAGSIAADALQPGMEDPWKDSRGPFKGPYASWSYGYEGEEGEEVEDEDEDEEYGSLA